MAAWICSASSAFAVLRLKAAHLATVKVCTGFAYFGLFCDAFVRVSVCLLPSKENKASCKFIELAHVKEMDQWRDYSTQPFQLAFTKQVDSQVFFFFFGDYH